MSRITTLACATLGITLLASGTASRAATLYSFDYAYSYERSEVTRSQPQAIHLPGPFGGITLDPGFLPFSPFGFDRNRESTVESLTVNVTGTFTCYAEEADPQLAAAPVAPIVAATENPGVAPEAEQLAVEASILTDPLELEAVLTDSVVAELLEVNGGLDCELQVADGGGEEGPAAVPSPSAAAAGLGLLMLVAARRRRMTPRRNVG